MYFIKKKKKKFEWKKSFTNLIEKTASLLNFDMSGHTGHTGVVTRNIYVRVYVYMLKYSKCSDK